MVPLRQLKGVDWLLTIPVFHSLGIVTERFVNLAFSRVAQSYLDPSWSW